MLRYFLFLFAFSAQAEELKPLNILETDRELRGFLAMDVIPLTSLVVPSYGFTIGTHINNRHSIEFHYSKGSVGLDHFMARSGTKKQFALASKDEEVGGEINGIYQDIVRTNITHSLVAFQHRFFVTDKFYTKFGFGLKQYAVEYPLSEVSKYEDLDAVIEVTKQSLVAGLGHRWVIDNALVGMEWVNATIPLSVIQKRDNDYGVDTFLYKYYEFTDQIVYSVFNLSAGVIF